MGVDLTFVPHTGGVSEDAVIQQLLAERSSSPDPSPAPGLPLGPQYEDEEFSPRELSTLYVDPSKLPEYASAHDGHVAWYRPTEYTDDPDYFKSPSGCGVLREGALPDAWLLGVFAALALHPDNLIENLFVSDSLQGFRQFGVYTCRFYKNCQWVTITTDTRVPYSVELEDGRGGGSGGGEDGSGGDVDERGSANTPGHVLYGGSLIKNEVFIPLLEKAYAKLHGSYQALAVDGGGGGGGTPASGGGGSGAGAGNVSGRILEALLDCTGGSALRVDLLDEKRRVTEESGGDATLSGVWRRLLKYKKRKCVVTAQLRQLSFNAYDLTPLGILKNRQYVVLHAKEVVVGGAGGSSGGGGGAPQTAAATVLRFVKLKNVWGRGMWKGEWSNDDSKWEEHLQVELAMRNDPACAFSRSGSDGCFWMVWEDFIESFTELYVAHVFGGSGGSGGPPESGGESESAYHQYCVPGEWVGNAAAGAPACASTSASTGGHRPITSSYHETDSGGGGGPPTVIKKERPIDRTKWSVLTDADPNWHRNRQFKLTVRQRTTGVLVSLLQRDFRLFGGDNYAINVVLLAQKAGKTSIVWEFARHKVVAEAHSYESNNFLLHRHHHHHHDSSAPPSTAGGGGGGGGATSMLGKHVPEREIVKEELVLEPDVAYFLVPYTDHSRVEMEFFLRVFAPKPVVVERVAPVFTCFQQGKWRNEETTGGGGGGGDLGAAEPATMSTSAGGPLCLQLHGGEENTAWCQNPQFWLRLKPMDAKTQANLLATKSAATLKITVRKTSTKSGGGGAGGAGGGGGGAATKSRLKELSKEKFNLVGITVLRAKNPLASMADDDPFAAAEKKGSGRGGGGGGGGAKSGAASSQASIVRAQAKAPKTNFLGEIIEKPQWKTSGFQRQSGGAKRRKSDDDGDDEKDDFDTKRGGEEKEEVDAKSSSLSSSSSSSAHAIQFPPPRLVVKPDEWCRISDYSSPLVACTYLRKLPKEWLVHENGGLMVVPTLGESGAEGTFDVHVDCDFPVVLDELPRFTTQSVPGEWDSASAVGCHLHSDWKKNPKLFLHLKGVRPAKVKITLTRSELEWAAKCRRDAVGTMMGFYLFHGQRLTRASDHATITGGGGGGGAGGGGYHSIIVNGRPWSETDFVPLHAVASPPELMLPSAFNEPYVIMPATYEPGKMGTFVLSVQCDTEFTLSSDEP